ncbi:MAG: hypothetical protein R2932_41860 [Caldilineaceae bacterium]
MSLLSLQRLVLVWTNGLWLGVGLILFLIILIFTLIQLKVSNRWVYYEE